jgi:hypothetical protein
MAFKDVATRFRLIGQGYKNVATRFRLVQHDAQMRLWLSTQGYKDIATRFTLVGQSYKNTQMRFTLTTAKQAEYQSLVNTL